jgi:hypothetical protein
MKLYNNLFMAILSLCFLTNDIHARTCAKKLRTAAKWYAAGAGASTLAIPAYGIGFGLMVVSIDAHRRALRNANLLEIATIMNDNLINREDDAEQKIIDKFYNKLIKLYPEMRMSKAEVIGILARVNAHQMGKQACGTLTGGGSLAREFFPEKKHGSWLAQKRIEDTKLARELAAARARDEKNYDQKNSKNTHHGDNSVVSLKN